MRKTVYLHRFQLLSPTSDLHKHWNLRSNPKNTCVCNILDFHGGDYEESRPLEHKNSVRASQETHYVSAREPSRLILCQI
jgi:hypothetical protein